MTRSKSIPLRVVKRILDGQALVLTDGERLTLWAECPDFAARVKIWGRGYRYISQVKARSL